MCGATLLESPISWRAKVISIKAVRKIISESVQDRMACTWHARWSGEESKENVWKGGGGKNLEGDLIKCLSITFK